MGEDAEREMAMCCESWVASKDIANRHARIEMAAFLERPFFCSGPDNVTQPGKLNTTDVPAIRPRTLPSEFLTSGDRYTGHGQKYFHQIWRANFVVNRQ